MAANDFRREVQERLTEKNIHLNEQEQQLLDNMLSLHRMRTTGYCIRCRNISETKYPPSINDPDRAEHYIYGTRESIEKIASQLRPEILTVLCETKNTSGCIGYCQKGTYTPDYTEGHSMI